MKRYLNCLFHNSSVDSGEIFFRDVEKRDMMYGATSHCCRKGQFTDYFSRDDSVSGVVAHRQVFTATFKF